MADKRKVSKKKSEILKKIPNYTKNVAKSTLFSSMDIIKEVAPEVGGFTESSAKIVQNAISEGRQYGSSLSSFLRNYKSSQIFKDVQAAKREAIDDLKSGNFYNKERSSQKAEEALASEDKKMLSDLGFDFDDTGNGMSDEDIINKMMGGSSPKEGNSAPIVNNLTISRDPSSSIRAVGQAAKMTSNVVLNSSQYVVDNQNAIYTMQSITSHKMFAEVSDRLQEMTGYLKGLFDYTSNISNYFDATLKYYDNTISIYDEIKAAQKELNELTRTIGNLNIDNDSDNTDITHGDVFRGGLDIHNYAKKVQQNVKNGSGFLSSMVDSAKMSADTAGRSMSSILLENLNPARMLSKGMAQKFIVNPIKENLEELNTTFGSFFKGLSLKGKRIADRSDNPLFNMIYDVLGIKPDDVKNISTATKAGPVQFNAYADRSIVEVMPTYLRKILSAITGEPEYVYDYTSGTFKTVGSIKRNYNSEESSNKFSSTYKFRNHADSVFDALDLTGKEKKDMSKKFSNFLDFLNENELFFNAHSDKYDDFRQNGISSQVDSEDFDFFKNIILSGKDKGLSLNDMVYNARSDKNDFIERKNRDIMATGDSALFNNFGNDNINDKEVKSNILYRTLSAKDYSGSSVFDYLGDIKEILMEGIFVYNVSTKSNATLVSKPGERLEEYRNRLAKSRAKQVGVSNSGKDTYGEEYMTISERNSLHDKLNGVSSDQLQELLDKKRNPNKNNIVNSKDSSDDEEKSMIRTMSDNIKGLTSMPMDFVNKGIKYVDVSLKRVLYGKDSIAYSFFDDLKSMMENRFTSIRDSFKEKIFDPLEEKLFGKDGIMTKFDTWFRDKMSNFGEKAMGKLLGVKNQNGAYQNGLFSGLANHGLDALNSIKRYATGKGYKSVVSGKEIDDLEGGSLFAYMKDGFSNLKDRFGEKLFGKVVDTSENGAKIRSGNGLVNQIKNKFLDTVDVLKDKYLGRTGISSQDVKDSLPKILKGAGIGMSLSLWSSMFLPLGVGIVPGLLLGGVAGFAKNNEGMQNFLFGDGEKKGILGGEELKNKISNYMPSMMKGFGIGAIGGLLTGNPVLGPIIGSAIGFATKSDKFKEFLFGKDGDDSKALIKKETLAKMKQVFPKAAGIGAGAFAYKTLGLFGSALLPGGILGAAMFGFASSMALNSDSVKKFLFGDIDSSTGKRDKTGIIGKLGVWFKYNFVEEVKYRLYDIGTSFKLWFQEKIGNKLQDAFKPIFEEIKLVGKKIVGFFARAINRTFEKSVGMPLGKFMHKIFLDPLKKVFGGLFNGLKKVAEMPFAMVGKVGTNLAKKHRGMGLDYTTEYFNNKNKRDKDIKDQNSAFQKDKKDRREKLSFLQRVLSSYGYNLKNENVKNAMNDFDTKYKKGKWRDFEISTYKSVNAIQMEEQKQTGLLDQLKGFGQSIAEYVSIKSSKYKDKLRNKGSKIYNSVSDKYEDIVEGYEAFTSNLHDKRVNASKDFRGKMSNVFGNWRNNVSGSMSSALGKGTNFMNGKVKELNQETNVDGSVDNGKQPVVNLAEQRRQNIKNGKYKVGGNQAENKKKQESNLSSINRHIKAIDREISGQLNGVGWNLDAIRKILAKFTGIDEKGDPLRRGNKKRSFFGKIKNALMRPVDFVMDVVGGIKDKIVGGITGIFTTVKNTVAGGFKLVGSVVKGGISILGTAFKTLGAVITEGAKVLGTLAVETTKVVGQVLVSSVNALGSLLSGLVEGVGKLGGALLSGIGSLASGIAKASGHVIAGLGKLTGGLLKASGTLISGIGKLTKDLTMTAYKGVKGLLKGIGGLVAAPFKWVGSKLGKGKSKGFMSAKIVNFLDLLNNSKSNPMWVNVSNIDKLASGGESYNGNGLNGNGLGGNRSSNVIPVDFGGDNTPIAPSVSAIDAKITNWNDMKPVHDILSLLKSKFGGNRGTSIPSESKQFGKVNNARVSSMTGKMLSNAESDVNSYADNVTSIKNFNFTKASDEINKIKADKVVGAQAMAQTAAASKGTFAFLAKHAKKGGLLSKLGTLLMLGLPAILRFFKNLKSGKWISSLASKFFGKGSMLRRFGGLLLRGVKFIGRGISSLVKLFMGTKLGKALGNGANKVLDKLLGKKNKITLADGSTKTVRDGVLGRGIDKVKTMGRKGIDKVKGLNPFRKKKANNTVSNFTEDELAKLRKLQGKNKNGSKINLGTPRTKTGSIVPLPKNMKTKNGKVKSALGKAGSIASSLVAGGPLSQFDPSTIENAIVINGNVLLQVNGSVMGGGFGGASDGTSSGNPLVDMAQDKLSDSISDRLGKRKKKKGGVVDLSEERKLRRKSGHTSTRSGERISIKRPENISATSTKRVGGKKKGHGKLALLGGIATMGLTSALSGGDDDNQSVVGNLAIDTANDVATDIVNDKVTGYIANKASRNSNNVVDLAAKRAGKTGAAVAGNVDKKGILTKISGLVNKICDSGMMKKIFGKHADILPKVASWVLQKIGKVATKKLPTILSKLTARIAGGVASLGIIPAAFVAYDGVSGMMETRQIFKLSPEAPVTWGMRVATGLAKAVSNNLTFGLIDSSDIANFLYGLVAGSEDKKSLENHQNAFKADYDKYAADQKSKGKEAKDFDSWNEEKNRGFFGKIGHGIWSGAKAIGGGIWNGAKAVGGVIASPFKALFGSKDKPEVPKVISNAAELAGDNPDVMPASSTTPSAVANSPQMQQAKKGFNPLHALGIGLGALPLVGPLLGKVFGGGSKGTQQDPTNPNQPINPLGGMASENGAFVINGNTTIEINGQVAGLGNGATRGASTPNSENNPFDKLSLTGGKVDLGTIGNRLSNDAGLLMTPPKNMSLMDQLHMIDGIRGQSAKLIEKSSTAAQLTMAKANDAIKNTASTYSNLASTTMNSTMNMATVNSTNNASSYVASQPTDGSTPAVNVGTPPAQVQSHSNGLLSTIRNVASSVIGGVSKFFGFGGNGGTSPNASSASSTPQGSGNTVNGMVYYNQNEEPWASKPYNGKGETNKTIHTSGCGVTSAAMVISSVTGKPVTPEEAANWSMQHGYKQAGVGTSWGFFDAFGKQFGVGFNDIQTNDNALITALKAKQPAILSGAGAAPFTKGGHFVVAAGVDNAGNVLINDPNHRSNNKAFSLQQLHSAGWANGWTSDKPLSGNMPAVPGGGVAGPGGAAPQAQQPSSPLDILGKIGSTLVDASSSILMGKVYEPTAQAAPGGVAGGAVNGSGTFAGAMGKLPLPAGVTKWKSQFDQSGAQYGIEPEVMEAISAQESGGDANNSNGYALGLMQIENTLASEFASFGRKTTGQAFSLADRADPTKAIPFATSRFSDDLKHYNGDYIKTLQAYNFSKYSLDMLLKKYPNDWMSHRKEMGSINGVGGSYGDSQYVEHVMRYYYGKVIKQAGGNGGEPISDKDIMSMPMSKLKNMALQAKNRNKGGNGGDNSTIIKMPKVTNTKSNIIDFDSYKGGYTKATDSGEFVQPSPPTQKIDNVKIEKFASHNMDSMSSKIDNMLYAKQRSEIEGVNGMDSSAILAVLNTISENTSETANNTKQIADKDFNVTHKYENNYENKQQIDNSSKHLNMNNTNNPFIEAANNRMKPMSGYDFAKRIAE